MNMDEYLDLKQGLDKMMDNGEMSLNNYRAISNLIWEVASRGWKREKEETTPQLVADDYEPDDDRDYEVVHHEGCPCRQCLWEQEMEALQHEAEMEEQYEAEQAALAEAREGATEISPLFPEDFEKVPHDRPGCTQWVWPAKDNVKISVLSGPDFNGGALDKYEMWDFRNEDPEGYLLMPHVNRRLKEYPYYEKDGKIID